MRTRPALYRLMADKPFLLMYFGPEGFLHEA